MCAELRAMGGPNAGVPAIEAKLVICGMGDPSDNSALIGLGENGSVGSVTSGASAYSIPSSPSVLGDGSGTLNVPTCFGGVFGRFFSKYLLYM